MSRGRFLQEGGKVLARLASTTTKSEPAAKKLEDEIATTQWGSSVFRVVNFELYAKPTAQNRMMGYFGSSVFVGILGYFTYMQYYP
jgi:hypothetical protein